MNRRLAAVLTAATLGVTLTPALASTGPHTGDVRPTMHVISDRGCDWIRTTTLLESGSPTRGRLGVKVYVDTRKVFVAWLSVGHRFNSVTINRYWSHDTEYRNHYVEVYQNKGDGQWALKRSVVTDPTACPT